ncbi:MAG: SufD family Fe-S cluster assembly protein [Actinobacteria bacterium]|nr:SufD family Fe-S cluster assembly protein [Actinomycetota bacterium]
MHEGVVQEGEVVAGVVGDRTKTGLAVLVLGQRTDVDALSDERVIDLDEHHAAVHAADQRGRLDIEPRHRRIAKLVCPVVELDVEAAGRLGYLKVQEQGAKTWQFGSVLARAERDATISAATAAFGGAYARTRADTRLVGRGAHGDLAAVYFGESEQTLDFRTYQDHVAPDTTSNLLYKGVVAGKSRSVYTGLIRVRPDARGTNAFQTNRNLKLSDDAWAESVPNLEIENNDVKCSHASTVSPVDEDQRFYLESRGVPTAEAERLIVAGFLGEVLAGVPVQAAVPALKSAIAEKLARQRELDSTASESELEAV